MGNIVKERLIKGKKGMSEKVFGEVGNQDKANNLIGTGKVIGKETKTGINDKINFKEAIQELALDFVKKNFMPSSDAKIFMTEACRLHMRGFNKSLVPVVSDAVDSAYQQHPKTKTISGCALLKYTIQDRKIVEIIGVSPEQEKKIEELIFSEDYLLKQ